MSHDVLNLAVIDRTRAAHAELAEGPARVGLMTNHQRVIGAEENVRARSPNHRPVGVFISRRLTVAVERYRTGTEPVGDRSRSGTVAVGEAEGTPHISMPGSTGPRALARGPRTPATEIDADLFAD